MGMPVFVNPPVCEISSRMKSVFSVSLVKGCHFRAHSR